MRQMTVAMMVEKIQLASTIFSIISSSRGSKLVFLIILNPPICKLSAMKIISKHATMSITRKSMNLPILKALTQLLIQGQ